MVYIIILLVIILFLLISLIFIVKRNKRGESSDSIKEINQKLARYELLANNLAKDVQSFQDPLNKLSNYLSGGTKAGKFGEWSLEAIIKDIFPSHQYEKNAEIIKGSGKRVEFAIKLPEGLFLPIDAKFSSGIFNNYVEAVEKTDSKLVKLAKDQLKRQIIQNAIDISSKYIQKGITIDLGIMYVPSENMMQLIDSLDDIRQQIFRDNRILVMGPNSLAAYLISVSIGFKTISLNENASDIMKSFGVLKKEFERFNNSTKDLLKKTEAAYDAAQQYSTREKKMSKAIDDMDKLNS